MAEKISNHINCNTDHRVRCHYFIGHGSGTPKKAATTKITQKEQGEILDNFKRGSYNVLVSTSIGEEGLDIGSVDLIINYDHPKSYTRTIQERGYEENDCRNSGRFLNIGNEKYIHSIGSGIRIKKNNESEY